MIDLIIVLILVGLGLWVVDQFPIDATIKRIIHVVMIVVVVVWLLTWVPALFPVGPHVWHYR